MNPSPPPLPIVGAKGAAGNAPLLRAIVLTGILIFALLAIVASWWITSSHGRSGDQRDFAARTAQLSEEADRVAESVAKRLGASQAAIDLAGLQAQKQAQAKEQQAQAPVVVTNAPVKPVSDVITFRLRGVVPTGAHPMAFIDDRTYGVGEVVSGFRIVARAAESVTFVDPLGQKRVVKLYGE